MIQIQTQDVHDMFYELRRTEQQANEKFFVRMPKLLQAMHELAQEQYRVLSGYNYNAHVEDNPSIRNEIQTLREQELRDQERKREIKELSKQIKEDRKRILREEKKKRKAERKEGQTPEESESSRSTVHYRNGVKLEYSEKENAVGMDDDGFRGETEGVYHEVEFVKKEMRGQVQPFNDAFCPRQNPMEEQQDISSPSSILEQQRMERKIGKPLNIYQAKSLSKKR